MHALHGLLLLHGPTVTNLENILLPRFLDPQATEGVGALCAAAVTLFAALG